MTCTPWIELCSARLDGELTHGEQAALDDHLAGCTPCRTTAAALARQHRVFRLRPAPDVPDRTDQILVAMERVPGRRSRWVPAGAAAGAAVVTAAVLLVAADRSPAQLPSLALLDVRAEPARAGSATAVYVYVDNSGGQDRLVDIESPVADRAELHETRTEDGTAVMYVVGSLPVPASGATSLVPGGAHLMLVGLRDDLRPGERVPLTLRFDRSGTIEVQATVEPA
jgi:hypothetical protein